MSFSSHLQMETDDRDNGDNMVGSNFFESYVKQIISRHSRGEDVKNNNKKSCGDAEREGEDTSDQISTQDFKISVTGYGHGGDVSVTETVPPISSFSTLSGAECDAKAADVKDKEVEVVDKKQPEVAEVTEMEPQQEKPQSESPKTVDTINKSDGDKVTRDKVTHDKPYYKFANNIQQALSTLNNQMSTTLRDSIVNIDEISSKVRKCLGEMDKHTKIYYSQFQSDDAETAVLISPAEEINPIIEVVEPNEPVVENAPEQRHQVENAPPPAVKPPAKNDNVDVDSNKSGDNKAKPKSAEKSQKKEAHKDDVYAETEIALEKAHEDFKKGVKELQNCMKRACDEQQERSRRNQNQQGNPRMRYDGDYYDHMGRGRRDRNEHDFKMYVDKCRRSHERNGYAPRRLDIPGAPPPTPVGSYNFAYPAAPPSAMMDVTKILKTVDVNLAKGKPVSDLNEKLRNQINASDSLHEFQIQMKRKPKTLLKISAEELFVPERNINKITKKPPPQKPDDKMAAKQPPVKGSGGVVAGGGKKKKQALTKGGVDVAKKPQPSKNAPKLKATPNGPRRNVAGEKKYENSLWFPSMSGGEQKKNDGAATPKCNRSVYNEKQASPPPTQQQAATITDKSQTKQISLTSACQMPWMRTTKSGQVLNCFDILDELTCKDVEPIQSEYPRKDEIDANNANNKVENSYLYKLLYGKNINADTAMAELFGGGGKSLEPSIECAQPNCEACKSSSRIKQHRFKPRGAAAAAAGLKSSSSEKAGQKIHHHHHHHHNHQGDRRIKSDRNVGGKAAAPPPKRTDRKNLTGSHVVEKLKPYLRDPHLRYPTTITIMPVRVTYNNMAPLPNAHLSNTHFENNASQAFLGLKRSEPCGDFETRRGTNVRVVKGDRKLMMKQSMEQAMVEERNDRNEKRQPLQSPQKKANKGNVSKPKTPSSIPTNNSTPRRKASTAPKTLSKVANDSRRMLSDIQTLAHKNNNLLQMNIQKVIEIIEGKIVDILSDPKKHNADAFQVVENEIKDVLEMMRTMDSSSHKSGKRKKAKEGDKKKSTSKTGASDHVLLAKLQAIADVDPSAEETSASDTNATMKSLPTPSLETNEVLIVRNEDIIKPPTVAPNVVNVKNVVVSDNTSSELTLPRDEEGNASGNEEKCVVTNSCSPRRRENDEVKNEKILIARSVAQKTLLEEPQTIETGPKVETKIVEKPEVNDSEPKKETTTFVAPIKSDMFLTPFMQAIKQRMNNNNKMEDDNKMISNNDCKTISPGIAEQEPKPSFHHIIQFLDTLTNISQDMSVTVYYKCTVNIPMVYHAVTVYYEVKQHYTVTYRDAPVTQKKLEPRRLLSGIFSGSFPTNLKSLIKKSSGNYGEPPKALIKAESGGDYNDLLTIDPKKNKALNLTLYTVTTFCEHPLRIYGAPRRKTKKGKKGRNSNLVEWKNGTDPFSKQFFSRDRLESYVLNVTYACIFTLLYIAFTVNIPGI